MSLLWSERPESQVVCDPRSFSRQVYYDPILESAQMLKVMYFIPAIMQTIFIFIKMQFCIFIIKNKMDFICIFVAVSFSFSSLVFKDRNYLI